MVEKEILALLRILDVRHSTLADYGAAIPLDARYRQVYTRRRRDPGYDCGEHHARESVDSILSSIAPRKQPRQLIPVVLPTVKQVEELLVVNFDGSPRVKRGGGACSAIVWKLPEWIVVAAESKYLPDLTVNEAEYQGLLLGFDLLSGLDRGHLIICGDSNLVIRQMRGEFECKAPGLAPLRRRALDRLRMWPAHEFLHVKRDWNQSADRLANTALHQQEGIAVTSEVDRDDLVVLTRLQELLLPKDDDPVAGTDRIQRAQDEEKWVVNLNAYLSGDFEELDGGEARAVGKIAGDYDVDESGLLFYSTHAGRDDGDRDRLAKLVEPEDLQQDVLHHYHTSLEGGSEELTSGSGRTFTGAVCLRVYDDTWDIARIVKPGRDAQLYEESRRKRNTELLFWVDLFSGYVMAKASASRTAQTIAESYEECVFPDLEQAKPSGTIIQRATMVYRQQANGTVERMVQTLTRALKMYVADINQKDWDEYAERLTFALNRTYDRVRGETPFYLVHGWDARSTLEATLPLGSTRSRDVEPRRWRCNVQRQYQQARKLVNEALRDTIEGRADRHNEDVSPHDIKAGDQ
ncbi:hypothetical protein L917_13711, partial [Phytophthora nicotianae]